MDGSRFDRFVASVSRRGLVGSIGALAGGIAVLKSAEPVAALDPDCRKFVLAAGPDRDDKFKHVDDDFRIELQRKGRRAWKTIFEDTDGTANDGGRHIPPVEFRARYGDRIRITAINRKAGGCEFDAVYLFCKGGRQGKKLLGRTSCGPNERDRINYVFLEETVRLKP